MLLRFTFSQCGQTALRYLISLLLMAGCLLPTASAVAQNSLRPISQAVDTASEAKPAVESPAPETPADAITPKTIADRRQALQQNTQLDDVQKERLAALYDQAEEFLQAMAAARQRVEQFRQRRESAPATITELKAQLEEVPTRPSVEVPAEASAAEVESLLAQSQAELDEAKKRLEKLRTEIEGRSALRTELPRSSAALRTAIAELQTQIAELPPAAEADAAQLAERTANVARLQALEAQLVAEDRQKDLLGFEPHAEQLNLQRELAERTVAARQNEVAVLRDAAEKRRVAEAQRQIDQARRSLAEHSATLESYLQRNLELAEQRLELAGTLKHNREQLAASRAALETSATEIERSRARIAAIGLTEANGEMLRKQRMELPTPDALRVGSAERQEAINRTLGQILDLQSRKTDIADIEGQVERILADVRRSDPDADLEEVAEQARVIVAQEIENVNKLLHDYNAYFNDLVELDEVVVRHAELIEDQLDYINERILWMRSTAPLAWSDFVTAKDQFLALFSRERIVALGGALWHHVRTRPLPSGFVLLVVLLGAYFGRRLRGHLREIGRNVSESRMTPLGETGRAILITLALAFIWPATAAFIGWSLGNSPDTMEYSQTVGRALFITALLVLPLELLRNVLRNWGIGIAHFHWPEVVCSRARRGVRWLLITNTPLYMIIILSSRLTGPNQDNPLGRLAYMASMAVLAWAAWRLFGPGSPIMNWVRSGMSDVWAIRAMPLLTIIGIVAPLALCVAAGMGYYFTATQLTWRLIQTIWLMLALLIGSGALLRWFVIARTQLARSRAREQRRLEQKSNIPVVQEVAADTFDDRRLDPTAISAQSKQLLHLVLIVAILGGLWVIWGDIAPALRALDDVVLISGGEPTSDASAESTATIELPAQFANRLPAVPESAAGEASDGVTLFDLSLACLTALLLVAILHNLPGTLELLVLQHLPMDAGARYAVSNLVRYALIVLGIILLSNLLGMKWSNVQWLVAAITVGLGFGLQEIFANFVSGVILLLERPMRIGDIVTIGDTSGVVSRIQMRATTITNWERQELIVPNKEFVTGRLLNWTLSNAVNRISVTVGVAHGSDLALADRTIRDVVAANHYVLDDPAPIITLENFGESSLNFTCRLYFPDIDNRLQAIHELHLEFEKQLRERGIQLARPLREIKIHDAPSPP